MNDESNCVPYGTVQYSYASGGIGTRTSTRMGERVAIVVP